jgi:hypothetical protein
MTSGQDVSEYLDTFGLVKSYFFKFFEKMQLKKIENKSKKKMSCCSDDQEDEAISLFAGLLANPDMTLSLVLVDAQLELLLNATVASSNLAKLHQPDVSRTHLPLLLRSPNLASLHASPLVRFGLF